jgi:hypothetical protein
VKFAHTSCSRRLGAKNVPATEAGEITSRLWQKVHKNNIEIHREQIITKDGRCIRNTRSVQGVTLCDVERRGTAPARLTDGRFGRCDLGFGWENTKNGVLKGVWNSVQLIETKYFHFNATEVSPIDVERVIVECFTPICDSSI